MSTQEDVVGQGFICLYNTQQILPGLAAVLSFRQHDGQNLTAPLVAFVWTHPKLTAEAYEARCKAFALLLEPFPWVRLIVPNQKEIQQALSQNISVLQKAKYLKLQFEKYVFDSLFFAHDISADFIAQSAMQAFPDAARVCFGDALGVVYSNDYFTQITYPLSGSYFLKNPRQLVQNILFRAKRTLSLPAKKRRLDAEYLALCLPCDPSGTYFLGKTQIPIAKNLLQQMVTTLSAAVSKALQKDPSVDTDALHSAFILLIGSYAESRLCSMESEKALYLAAAKAYISPGSTLILKPHPGASKTKIAEITTLLSKHYKVLVFRHFEIPIEFMLHSIAQSTVISFSYASVSLRYLNKNIQVIHAMDDALINQFFSKATQKYMQMSNQLYIEQRNNLSSIDGVF